MTDIQVQVGYLLTSQHHCCLTHIHMQICYLLTSRHRCCMTTYKYRYVTYSLHETTAVWQHTGTGMLLTHFTTPLLYDDIQVQVCYLLTSRQHCCMTTYRYRYVTYSLHDTAAVWRHTSTGNGMLLTHFTTPLLYHDMYHDIQVQVCYLLTSRHHCCMTTYRYRCDGLLAGGRWSRRST